MSEHRELSELRDDAAAWAAEAALERWRDLSGLPVSAAGSQGDEDEVGAVARTRRHRLACSRDGLAQASELFAATDQAEKPGRAARLSGLRALLVQALAEAQDPSAAAELRALERRPLVELHGDAGLHGKLAPRVVARDLGHERNRQVRADQEAALAEALGRFDGLRAGAWEAAQEALGELKLGEPGAAAARLHHGGWTGPASSRAEPTAEASAQRARQEALGDELSRGRERPGERRPSGPLVRPLSQPAADAPSHAGAALRACHRLLQATDPIALDLLAWLLERHTGARRAPGDAERHDLLHLIEAPRCAPAFPRGELLRTCRRWAEQLRLDLTANGKIRLDEDDRPLKAGGAHVVALDPPGEVRLSLAAAEGPRALAGLLGALAVAQLRAGPPGDAPEEDLWCGDPAVAIACAALFSGLLRDDPFRRRIAKAELGPDDARAVAVAALVDARLAAARALVELEAHREGLGARAATLHRELYARAGLVQLPAGLALCGLDPLLGGFSELRGLALAARIRSALRERYDEDWWRNPRALLPLGSLWSRGGRPTVRELWSEVAPGEEPSVEPLIAELAESCR